MGPQGSGCGPQSGGLCGLRGRVIVANKMQCPVWHGEAGGRGGPGAVNIATHRKKSRQGGGGKWVVAGEQKMATALMLLPVLPTIC